MNSTGTRRNFDERNRSGDGLATIAAITFTTSTAGCVAPADRVELHHSLQRPDGGRRRSTPSTNSWRRGEALRATSTNFPAVSSTFRPTARPALSRCGRRWGGRSAQIDFGRLLSGRNLCGLHRGNSSVRSKGNLAPTGGRDDCYITQARCPRYEMSRVD
jgi:hypothetical protein